MLDAILTFLPVVIAVVIILILLLPAVLLCVMGGPLLGFERQ